MNKKVLLLQLNVEMPDTAVYVNHGLSSIAGTLRKAGFYPEIIILDTRAYRSGEWLKSAVESGYIFAGISVYSNQWRYAVSTAKKFKKVCNIPVIGGGPHCSLFPQSLSFSEGFDAFVAGEGEAAIATLAIRASKGEPFSGIQGVWTRSDTGEVVPAGATRVVSELNRLAEPAYDLYPRRVVSNYPGLIFSRGCPYSCSYCCNAAYRRHLGLVNVRFLSPELAVQRAKKYASIFQLDYLNFDDDTFTKNPKWLAAFLNFYTHSVGLPFNCNARPETVNPDICMMLENAGCRIVALGCESGSETLRQSVLNRKMSDDTIIRASRFIQAAGMKLSTFNMVGIPGERWADYLKTVALNRRLAPSKVQMSVYYPFRGTVLGDLCFERGLVRNNDTSASYFGRTVLHLVDFPAWQIRIAQRLFKFLVFIKSAPLKACFELLKDTIKSLPFCHILFGPWLQLKRYILKSYTKL